MLNTKSRNLTSLDRDTVCNAILQHRFGDERAKLDKQFDGIVRRIYRAGISAALEKKMMSLPAGAVRLTDDGTSLRCNLGGDSRWMSCPDAGRPLPYDHREFFTFAADHAVTVALRDFDKANVDLNNRRKEARAKTYAALREVRSTKQLFESWPEAYAFLPNAPAAGNLPAIPVAELNSMLDLPPKNRKKTPENTNAQ